MENSGHDKEVELKQTEKEIYTNGKHAGKCNRLYCIFIFKITLKNHFLVEENI